MSSSSGSRSGSSSDLENCPGRRHKYNTRSAKKRDGIQQLYPIPENADPSSSQTVTNSSSDNCAVASRMDYYDPCNHQNRKRLSCQKIIETFLILGVLSLLYVSYALHFEIQAIKEEIQSIRGVNRSNETRKHSKSKSKQSCDNRMKLLLNDPVDRPDFALESTGGKVLNVDASVYIPSSNTFLGITLCEGQHGPSAMIHATHAPGECWAFKGHVASANIELIGYVLIDAVTLEHIPKSLSPSGSIDSAPKEFKIWGMDDGQGYNKRMLGQFVYDADGDAIQSFQIVGNTNYYKYVQFEVLTNHGNQQFTCVYRVRVHGTMSKVG